MFKLIFGNESILINIKIFKRLLYFSNHIIFLLLQSNYTKLINIDFSWLINVNFCEYFFNDFQGLNWIVVNLIVCLDEFLLGECPIPILVDGSELLEHVLFFLVAVDVDGDKLPHDDFEFVLHSKFLQFEHNRVVKRFCVDVVLNPRVIIALFCWKSWIRVGVNHMLN